MPRQSGKTMGALYELHNNPSYKFLGGDQYFNVQSRLTEAIEGFADPQFTTSVRGHSLGTTFILDELMCYSHSYQDYIVSSVNEYNFIVFTGVENFTRDISDSFRKYVYNIYPEYLL